MRAITDPFEIAGRFATLPVPALVDALRRVHQTPAAADVVAGRMAAPFAGAERSPAAERGRGVDSGPAGAPDAIGGVVAALRRLHEGTRGASDYDTLRRRLADRERRLRHEASLTEAVLSRVEGERRRAGAEPSLAQQEVWIRCAAGARSGGRFVLSNPSSRVQSIQVGVPDAVGSRRLAVACEPCALRLAPGEDAAVRVRVDLTGHPAGPGEVLELGLDILVDSARRAKVWITIGVGPAEAE